MLVDEEVPWCCLEIVGVHEIGSEKECGGVYVTVGEEAGVERQGGWVRRSCQNTKPAEMAWMCRMYAHVGAMISLVSTSEMTSLTISVGFRGRLSLSPKPHIRARLGDCTTTSL